MRLTREAIMARAVLREPLVPLSCTEWWRGCALYQVYVRSFKDSNGDGIGDLRGVIEKLDYIKSLNVDGFWLSPFFKSPQKDFGYDVSDFRSVDELYGTMADFEELLAESHKRDLKLLVDFVPAHTSDEHPWFEESRADRTNPKADWYIWADASVDGTAPSNWLSSFGGSAWTWEPRRSQYYYHPFLGCQPALNLQNPDAADALIGELEFWLELGVDGMRLDAVQCLACDPDFRNNPPIASSGSAILIGGGPNNPFGRQSHDFDRDVPEALPIVRKLRDAADKYTPERALIGELADVDSSRISEKYTAATEGFHAVYDFDLINAEPDGSTLATMLDHRSAFLRTGWLMNVFSNHDSKRSVSNLTAFATDAGHRCEAAKMLAFMQFTLKGGGILFQGEELGLPHPKLTYEELRDPWGKNLWPDFEGRDGARTPMAWQKSAPHAGFTSGTPWIDLADEHCGLTVDGQERDPDSNLSFVRRFLAWRREQKLLMFGGERVRSDQDDASVIVWDRYGGDQMLTCVVNFGLEPKAWRHADETFEAMVFSSSHRGKRPADSDCSLAMPPLGFAILARRIDPATADELP
jgi:alpha-glucosidase